eukprot:scaffold132791_cov70-Attheya_sp.AAC.1
MDLIHDRRHQQQRGTIGLLAPGSGDIAPPDASGYGGLSTTHHGQVPIGSRAIGSPDSSLYDDVERFSERFNPEHRRTDINVDSYRRFIPRQVRYEDVEFVHPHRNSSSLIRDVRYDEVKFVGDLHATQQHPKLYSSGFLQEELPDTSLKEAGHLSKDEFVEIAPNGVTAVYNGVSGTFFPHHNKIEESVTQKSVHKDHPTSIKISAGSSSTQSSILSSHEDNIEKEYPPNQFFTDNDDLLSSFLSLSQFDHLLSEGLDNVLFIFEESTITSTKSLSSMGPLSAERWSLTKPRLHCVMQNTNKSGMYYLARKATDCHYQVHIRSLIKALIAYEGVRMEVLLYNPNQDYSNNFMVVGNSVNATRSLNKKINWNSIQSIVTNGDNVSAPEAGSYIQSSAASSSSSTRSSSSSTISSRKRKRQAPKNFIDFGWTSSTCQTRTGSATGVALPRLKPDTDTQVVKKLFSSASSIVKQIDVPWIDSPNESLFKDSNAPDRQVQFQEHIVAGNIIEAIRVAKSNVTDLCAPHEDTQNSSKPT